MYEGEMKRISVGIDSSSNLRYSMVIAGPEGDVEFLHRSLLKVLNDNGVKSIHFNDIEENKIKLISREAVKLIRDSKRISFVMFEHKKPCAESNKKYYFEYVPDKITDHLCDFDSRNRLIIIDVHDDYNVRGLSTEDFMDSVIRILSRKMSRDDVGIKVLDDGDCKSSKIISKNGNYIKIRVKCFSHANSKSVNIADISMGLFKRYPIHFSGKIKLKKI